MKTGWALALLLGGCAAGLASATAADQPLLDPFLASYSVVFRGLNAGSSELELKRGANEEYVYSSRSNARGLFRVFFSDEIIQSSWFKLADSGVQPQRYRADDGSSDTDRDIKLDFDWRNQRVTGVAEDVAVDTALTAPAQDAMSIQIALMYDLLRGHKPTAYWMVDKNQLKEYQYFQEGDARLKTALGELDAVVYRSQRPNSKRVTRMWYAPSLGFIPVRAERVNNGKREWYMDIKTLERK